MQLSLPAANIGRPRVLLGFNFDEAHRFELALSNSWQLAVAGAWLGRINCSRGNCE